MPAEVAVNAIPGKVTPGQGEGALGHDGSTAPPTQDTEPECVGQRILSIERCRKPRVGWVHVSENLNRRTRGKAASGKSWSPTGSWEIRPTGMITGASGNVDDGSS